MGETLNNPVSVKNSEHYKWGEVCDGWHLLKRDDLSIIQEAVPPGKKEVRHYHKISNQFFYILSGMAVMEINGEDKTLIKNQGIFIQAGVPHQLKNESSELLEFIVVSSPKSHGDRYEA
jgi:mannose-6-phosphate isomerase-like protein (cupin superfamily)